MADIRIKDLATLESASLTGDVFVIDGTTGTRKLNAFSPTFGGNATVTGTLTVNGAVTLSSSGTNTVAGVIQFSNATPYLFPNAADKTLTIYGSSNANVGLTLYGDTHATKASQAEFIGSTLVRVLATTASTSTSSGALVVGNGTSGGLGVGGAINSGGAITAGVGTHSFGTSAGGGVNNFGALLTYFNIRSTSDSDNPIFRVYDGRVNVSAFEVNARTGAATVAGTLSVADGGTVSSAGTIRLSNNTSIGWRNAANSADIFLTVNSSNIFAFGSGAPVYVNNSIASTSTSSGALVVSGGVGVAGNVWTGGQVNLAATSVEASTGINFGVSNGASRDLVFFGDGTRGGMLRGYHDGSNIARLGFGFWASSGDTYTSVIDITGSATASSQLVAIAGTASSTSTTSGALTVAGGMGVVGAVNAGTFYGLVDGVTAPGTESGYARIYVDSADGDLKVKFGDGTVKTIATDS